MLKRGLVVVGALVLAELGLWIWGLWPMPDPRFDWPRYFDEAVAAKDCETATLIAAHAIQFHEQRGLDAARLIAAADWCPLGAKTFHDPQLLDNNLPWMIEHHRDPYTWAPGWRGRWNALPWILREELPTVFSTVRKKRGWFLAAAAFQIELPLDLRCSFALTEQPVMAYYAMRRHLAKAHPDLALNSWDKRAAWCLEVAGGF
ncbi:MAG: hypothetical protein U1E87_06845 [Alphaproteobacteria bacterium]